MKCQILFPEKNKKNIVNLLSAEYALRVVKVKMLIITIADDTDFFSFSEKIMQIYFLTLKALSKIAADNILIFFTCSFREHKTCISCELSA